MATERVERRLTAILAADVAGYSHLTGVDEEGTHVRLKECLRVLVDPKITEHHGRIVKYTGDGMLAEFSSVVDAVRCAVDVQRGMAERNTEEPKDKRIEFRIGINVGDIIIDGGDIFGDGVNVAARLEGLADPGGICVSGRVQEDTRGKLDVAFEDAGEQQLKNIARPVRVYRLRFGQLPARPALALPSRPSIAVLPFQNMSGDPEQEYFADGMVEDIITALSRMSWLFVIARNSSFTYKGKAVDVKQVGRELGVRYVLEGSVRKSVNRVRITGQLIDAATGVHLWADRFDGALDDIFDLQDQMTSSVVCAIMPKLEQAEIERAKSKPTESLDAYDYYLRGVELFYQRSRESICEALRMFYRAIEFDANFATAYAMAAWCYSVRQANRWMEDRAWEIGEAERLARKAVELSRDDAVALSRAGHALVDVAHDFETGAYFIERALVLNPNLLSAWYASGWLRVFVGEPEKAIKHLEHCRRISPLDPATPRIQSAIAFAHIFAGRYDEAASHAEQALSENPNLHMGLRVAATSHALAGRMEQATKAMARLRQIDPALRVSNLQELTPLRRPEDIARYAEGLRKAGLPE